MILNALYMYLHIFSLRRESPDEDPGRQTPHFKGGSVTLHSHCKDANRCTTTPGVVPDLYKHIGRYERGTMLHQVFHSYQQHYQSSNIPN
jgi:hypothetical protein